MNTATRRSMLRELDEPDGLGTNGEASAARSHESSSPGQQFPKVAIQVYIAAENRLLRDALAKMLAKQEDIHVSGQDAITPFSEETFQKLRAEVFLFVSRGNLDDDLAVIRTVRAQAPQTHIVIMGMGPEPGSFLECVRAGVRGYLLRDASTEEVLRGVRAVHAGEATCSGVLCNSLFQYLERDAALMPCVSARRRLGLTRREQQLIPFIAQGLTNKEIANHFSLSEQTVKNHLYRMKHKVGAEDRLDIVQLYRTQGFLT